MFCLRNIYSAQPSQASANWYIGVSVLILLRWQRYTICIMYTIYILYTVYMIVQEYYYLALRSHLITVVIVDILGSFRPSDICLPCATIVPATETVLGRLERNAEKLSSVGGPDSLHKHERKLKVWSETIQWVIKLRKESKCHSNIFDKVSI